VRGSMSDGFNKKTAELEAFSFEVDREIKAVWRFGRVASDESIGQVLDEVYTLLNIGGDLTPHTTWSQAYRDAENRSLSKGDVILIEGAGYFTVGATVGQDDMPFIWGYQELAGGEYWVTKGLERYAAKYGTRRPWEVAV
jgi:hypothetical protein